MKTNYRRRFIARNDRFKNVSREYLDKDPELGVLVTVANPAHCLCRGGHGGARNRKGAKKFTHSRRRAKVAAILTKVARDRPEED